MKKIKSICLPVVMLMIVILQGCYYDVGEELYPQTGNCDTVNVTYSGHVKNVIQNNCLVCHSAAANLGNINLEGYTQVKQFADNGKLLGAISHAQGFSPMPQNGNKLPDCTINQISAWINKGSINN